MVDLPEPFSPTKQWTVFREMSQVTSFSARVPGNCLCSPLMATNGPDVPPSMLTSPPGRAA